MALPWENEVLRLAAYVVAAGLVWRYVIVPGWRKVIVGTYRGARTAWRNVKALTAEVETIRALAAETHALTKRELTTNGGKSTKDQINKTRAAVHVLGELFTAHLADSELQHHHMAEQLREQGINIVPLLPRERWRWINNPDSTDDSPEA